MVNDTKNKLSVLSVGFHWVIALLFITLIVIGKVMEDMPPGPEKFQFMSLHKSIGALFLLVAIARVIYRLVQGFPENLSTKPAWQEKAAKGVHHLLLLATILMPVSGVMMSVGGGYGLDVFGVTLFAKGEEIEWVSEIGHVVHGAVGNLIILVIALHAAAAIKQQLVDKTLSRMLGRSVEP